MRHFRQLWFLLRIAALAGAIGRPVLAADSSPDSTAKFLAGLAVPASSAERVAQSPWVVHLRESDRAWRRTEQQQLPAVANWSQNFLGDTYRFTGPMFYMFSGPDFLYAHAFFPAASTYILCGKEPVGAVPDLNTIPGEVLPTTLSNLRKSLESVLSFNFFITKDMKTDLTGPQLSGTLPLLYVFLARTGYTIESVTAVTLDGAGKVTENGATGTPGVRISMSRSPGPSQTLYYFCTDLSDTGIRSHPDFLRFCENRGPGVSLLKATSYLMHDSSFSRVRDFLLRQSELIVQDDSGIPLRYLEQQNWTVRYCGHYVGPITVFKQYWQPDLADAYSRVTPTSLPFSFGYQWQPNRSDLMIVARNDAENGAVATRGDIPYQTPIYVAEAQPTPSKTEYRQPPAPRRDASPNPAKSKERLIPRM